MGLAELVSRVPWFRGQKPEQSKPQLAVFTDLSSEDQKSKCYRALVHLVAFRYLTIVPFQPSMYGQEFLRPFFNLKMEVGELEQVLNRVVPQVEISESGYLRNFACEALRPGGTDLPLYTIPPEEFEMSISTRMKEAYVGSTGFAMLMACSVLGQAENNSLIRVEKGSGLEEPLIKRTDFQLELPFTYHH